MAIENRTLTPGTQLTARYRKEQLTCTVEQGDDGKLIFVLADGSRHTSLSAAGSAVMNGTACNGWRFRSLAGTADALAVQPKARTPKAKRRSPLIKRLASQKGVEPGMVQYFCAGCRDGFTVPAGEEPAACPKGHLASEAPAATSTTG